MGEYKAPIKDMRFVLNNVIGLDELSEIETFSHAESDVVDAVLEEASKLATNVLSPLNKAGDLAGTSVKDGVVTSPEGWAEAYKMFAEGGWNGISSPEEFEGGAMPQAVTLATVEMWNAANLSFALCPLLTQGAIESLIAHGSDEQKEKYLNKLVTGEWTATMNLTESHAGSDVGALRAKAEPAEDGSWRISGQKIFITYGEHEMTDNIIHLVLARTPGSPAGTRGISLFIVPKFLVNDDGSLGKRNDLKCVSLEEKIGIHASPTAVMSYGDNGDCVGYLIGGENKGMACMFTMMNSARLGVGTQGLAIAERAYQQAVEYALDRKQGKAPGTAKGESAPIVKHADVRRMLMTMKSQIEAMRCLIYLNGASLDKAHNHPDKAERERQLGLAELLIPLSKGWCTDLGVELASIGVQIHGGMGFIEETGAGQHYRDARILPIYEGTNGIQALDLVGRKLGLQGGAPVRNLLSDMDRLAHDMNGEDAELAEISRHLGVAVTALREATEWMYSNASNDPNAAPAGATPYLRMFATTVGGYLMAQSAVKAKELLEAGDADQKFLKAKVATARFFAAQILPQAAALLGPVTEGPELLFAIDEENLVA
ncbi:acyl-CoA dehydrogenase C-terminal domain-containing protein [Sneathiella sp.]|jgi:alkylation response protein AidB-like acyl-CoA dehydrogenase|uniref:acyl-CoA dehydrogenase C-terminal domain-containing protein n=1 Tax=Sneathiella sp. TaxID=1964365 RepID=UPI0039E29FA2